jgi:hypothetical protein
MRSSNRSSLPDSHTVTIVFLWIAASVVVIVGTLVVVAYFALGRPDALFAGGSFPQLVSGAKSLTSALPTPDPRVASILSGVVTAVVIAFVAVIGAIGIWDAWQSRQRRSERSLQRRGPPATDSPSVTSGANGATDVVRSSAPPTDAETLYSPDIARARTRRSHRLGTDPDTWQGGTA